MRITLLTALPVVLLACGGRDMFAPETLAGTISGRVVQSPMAGPVADAPVVLHPLRRSTRTDAEGRFRFASVEIPRDGATYTVITTGRGVTVSELVALTRRDPTASVVLTIPAPGEEPRPPVEGLHLRSVPGFGAGTVSFTVDVASVVEGTVANLVVRDSLDEVFGASLSEESIVVNRGAFPDARVALDPERRSFSVAVGTLEPTEGFVRLYTVTAPTPPPSVACNVVRADGRAPAGPVSVRDISCVAPG